VTDPDTEKELIRQIAMRVREEQFESCGRGPSDQCDVAASTLSRELDKAEIRHRIVAGQWIGAVDQETEEQEAERGHMWIEFPQHRMILDISADQFTDAPSVWFPAPRKFYEKMEVVYDSTGAKADRPSDWEQQYFTLDDPPGTYRWERLSEKDLRRYRSMGAVIAEPSFRYRPMRVRRHFRRA
jgi:hypothetical protein